jgi:hypothetical protein
MLGLKSPDLNEDGSARYRYKASSYGHCPRAGDATYVNRSLMSDEEV